MVTRDAKSKCASGIEPHRGRILRAKYLHEVTKDPRNGFVVSWVHGHDSILWPSRQLNIGVPFSAVVDVVNVDDLSNSVGGETTRELWCGGNGLMVTTNNDVTVVKGNSD